MVDSAIIGYGIVGKATAKTLGIEKYFDLKGSNITLKEAARYRFIFGCLPTPVKEGTYDTSAIEGIVKQLQEERFGGIFINRSTVLPGFARHLMGNYGVIVVSNPEFLSEQTAEFDAKHPDFVVIGGDVPSNAKAVRGIYESRFKGLDVIETDTVTAEMIKISMNAFYLTKVVFANEIYDLCQRNGANYEQVKESIYKNRYGTKNHFDIWHKGGRGAGGRCLSKDFQAFATYANSGLLSLIAQKNKFLLETYPKTNDRR